MSSFLVNAVSAGIAAHFDTIRIVIGGWYGGVVYAAVSGTLVGRSMPPYRWGGKSRVYPRWREIQGRTLMPDKSHAPCRASMPELLLLSDGLWQRITLRSDTRIRHSRKGVSKHTNDHRIQESGLQNLPPRVIACFSGCFLLPLPYLEQAKGRLKSRLRFSDGLFHPHARFVFSAPYNRIFNLQNHRKFQLFSTRINFSFVS